MRLFPHLMFEAPLDEVLALWRQAFGTITVEDVIPGEDGRGAMRRVTVAGQTLSLFDSPAPHDFTFTPSTSLMVHCDLPEEVDYIAAVLGQNGEVLMPLDSYDFSPRYTWITDRFGLSWQIMAVQE